MNFSAWIAGERDPCGVQHDVLDLSARQFRGCEIGYPVHGGKALVDCEENIEPVKKKERVRIAHALDLLGTGKWHLWQRDCFERERIQPFKQVFRELYPLTDPERTAGEVSRRYAGHQVQPRQALALLGGRGWVHHPEEGVRRTFHELDISAWLVLQETFWTPAEIEGRVEMPYAATIENLDDGTIRLSVLGGGLRLELRARRPTE